MKKTIFILMAVFMLTGFKVFADDVSIDSSGNVKTGVSNANAELEVTGASGEGGILGSASGTGASGMYGINTTYGNYGILGYDSYGVFGYSSGGWAGYFQGNVRVAGNLTVDGSIIGPVIGDITGVTAGTGLNGGGASGDVTLNANTTYLQRRVSSSCSVGSSIRSINEDGTVSCETDDIGITGETDPEVGVNSLNYIPKWDGSALVSGSIFDNGNVGIGTTNPSNALEVARDQSSSIIRATSYMNDNSFSPGMFIGRRAHGTMSVPGAVQTNDYLAVFAGSGYGPTGWLAAPSTRGRMDISAAENWTDTAQGAYVAFRTTPVGTINSVEKVRITDAGDVGIGTTNPSGALEVARDQVTPIIRLTGYRADAGSPVFFMGRRARGTMASPSAVQADDILAAFAGTAYGTTGWPANPTTRGRLDITAAENWTDTAQGTNMIFHTTPIGMMTLSERMRITDEGNVGIGTTTPVEKLTVAGTIESTSGGIKFPDGTIQTTAAATGEGTSSNKNPLEIALLKWYTNKVTSFTVGDGPQHVAFDGANIWVTNYYSNTVTKLNAATGAVVGTYSGGISLNGIAFDGANMWITNGTVSGTVKKISAATGTTIGTYSVGNSPQGIAFDGDYIWVVNYGSNNVTKLNAATGSLVGTYSVGANPKAIVFDGDNIWVTSIGDSTVTKLNAATGALVGTYSMGTGYTYPWGIAFDGANIWVANNWSHNVMKLDAATGTIVGTYSVTYPTKIAFDGTNIWVTSSGTNTVTKLNAATGSLVGAYTVGTWPEGIAFDGANIWVANTSSDTVSKL